MDVNELSSELSKTNDRTEQIEKVSEFILNQKKIFNSDKALSGTQIFNEYQKLSSEDNSFPSIPKNTFGIYLSKISNSAASRINCQGRKQGYYFDRIFEQIEETTKTHAENDQEFEDRKQQEAMEKGNLHEKHLYPFLEQWLFQLDNERVADISSNRSQGKWANPDLVGLKIDNLFGNTEVEITTIEAKLTIENWEQWIFEAVAHTIFSIRSYFAFVHSEDHLNKIDADLKHYAETFKVGVLIIAIGASDYLKIQKKEQFQLTDENYKIVEYSPAPFNIPHVKFKKRFLKNLGIHEPKDLYCFGKAVET